MSVTVERTEVTGGGLTMMQILGLGVGVGIAFLIIIIIIVIVVVIRVNVIVILLSGYMYMVWFISANHAPLSFALSDLI